jgi:DNA-3-methyladenine glycosylase I
MAQTTRERYWWAGDGELMVAYRDDEWGVSVDDTVRLFEMLSLEGSCPAASCYRG